MQSAPQRGRCLSQSSISRSHGGPSSTLLDGYRSVLGRESSTRPTRRFEIFCGPNGDTSRWPSAGDVHGSPVSLGGLFPNFDVQILLGHHLHQPSTFLPHGFDFYFGLHATDYLALAVIGLFCALNPFANFWRFLPTPSSQSGDEN